MVKVNRNLCFVFFLFDFGDGNWRQTEAWNTLIDISVLQNIAYSCAKPNKRNQTVRFREIPTDIKQNL